MAITLRDQIIGGHLLFAREGETIDGDVVTADTKPDIDPITNWTSLGTVEEFVIRPMVERVKRYGPSPGAYKLIKQITTRQEMELDFKILELSELFWEMLLLTGGPITTDYTPLAGDGIVRGWFKVQAYDQSDTLRNVLDIWAEITVDETTFNQDLVDFNLKMAVLTNALNTGTITP